MRSFLFVFFVLCVPFFVFAAAGDVVINEIAWSGTAASASDEWIELRNAAQSAIDVSGWTLSFFKPATTTPSKVIALSGSIPAGGFYLIERTDEKPTDIPADFVSSFGTGLVDSGMILELARNGAAVDRTPELCESAWCAGSNSPKTSMERIKPDADGAGAANWATNNGAKINGTDAAGNPIRGTPKRENSVFNNPVSSLAPDSSSSSPVSSSSVSPSHPIYPALSVDAGLDRTVLVGSSVSFSGLALGINGTPLFDGRFLWNFGDGVTQEGRAFEHVYYFPGAYAAALTVASGQYSGFDAATITAIVPQLSVKNIQIGEDGFVVVANGSDARIDLGGIILRDSAGAQFLIPKNTFVVPKGAVTIPNRVSGLLKSGGAVLLYDAAGREVRAAQLTTNSPAQIFPKKNLGEQDLQPATQSSAALKPVAAVITISPPTGLLGGTLKEGEASNVRGGVADYEDASAPQKETAAVLQASQNTKSGISTTPLFFGASIFIGVLSAVGFFLLKNLF